MKYFLSLCIGLMLIFSCGTSKDVTVEHANTTVEKTEPVAEVVTIDVTQTIEKVEDVIDETKITWLDFETAIDKNAAHKKFIFIDIYTDWCGWCKKMDASTFMDKEVIKYLNTHFYAVKMNAESKEPIAYKGHLHEYKQYNAKAGYNTLAAGLLDGKMSFPSFVVLNKKEVKKGKIAGYKDAKILISLLKGYVE